MMPDFYAFIGWSVACYSIVLSHNENTTVKRCQSYKQSEFHWSTPHTNSVLRRQTNGPCKNHIHLKEKLSIRDEKQHRFHYAFKGDTTGSTDKNHLRHSVFERTEKDNKLSIEDEIFLDTMEKVAKT